MEHSDSSNKRIGLGLVEISALGTLIGATSAETLTSGLKSAAGLPWAAITTFGSVHCAKATMALFFPDWAREALGLRNTMIDAGIGLSLEMDMGKSASEHRIDTGLACALWTPYIPRWGREKTGDRGGGSGPSRGSLDATKSGGSIGEKRGVRLTISEVSPSGEDECKSERTTSNIGHHRDNHQINCMYAFDRSTTFVLSKAPPADLHDEIKIHNFHPDIGPFAVLQNTKDWAVILGSLCKGVEVYILWALKSETVWWATALPWAQSFIAAVTLQALNLSRDGQDPYLGQDAGGSLGRGGAQIDIISGELPSPLHPGGLGKIVIGMSGNVRRSFAWKVHWGLASVATLLSTVAIFVVLGSQSAAVVYTWVAFQALWMVLRSGVYHYLRPGDAAMQQGMLVGYSWKEAPSWMRERALRLLFALGKYQVTRHPRGVYSYEEDILDLEGMIDMFQSVGWTVTEELTLPGLEQLEHSGGISSRPTIEIVGIVGDTVLRSVSWVKGLRIPNADLYDVAMVFMRIEGSLHAVPCIRVLAAVPTGPDTEEKIGTFPPRGTSNSGENIWWVYWIPISADGSVTLDASDDTKFNPAQHKWIELRGMKVLNKNHDPSGYIIRDWASMQMLLQAGELSVSLTNPQEVVNVVNFARCASKGLNDILRLSDRA